MNKLLIAVQYCPLDQQEGEALLRLITDLEEKKNEAADILISTRFDLTVSRELVEYVARRFNVHTHVCRRRSVGWPSGCNSQMADTYSLFIEQSRAGRWPYDYILFLEADDVPLRRGWIEEIRKEAYDSGKLVIGPWLKNGDCGHEHINGNCVIHKDFFRKCKRIVAPPGNQGWDWYLRHDMMRYGHPSKLIYSEYRLGTSDNPWRGDDFLWEPKRYRDPENALYGQDLYPAIIHGTKQMLALDAVRKKLLTLQNAA